MHYKTVILLHANSASLLQFDSVCLLLSRTRNAAKAGLGVKAMEKPEEEGESRTRSVCCDVKERNCRVS